MSLNPEQLAKFDKALALAERYLGEIKWARNVSGRLDYKSCLSLAAMSRTLVDLGWVAIAYTPPKPEPPVSGIHAEPHPLSRMTVREAAAYIHRSPSFLNKRRVYGGGPEYLKLGASIIYERSTLDAWLAANAQRDTPEAKP